MLDKCLRTETRISISYGNTNNIYKDVVVPYMGGSCLQSPIIRGTNSEHTPMNCRYTHLLAQKTLKLERCKGYF